MRRLLNTLYVTTPDAFLAREGENVLVKAGEETKLRVPVHNLEGIVSFGYTGASPALMSLCCQRGVALTFLSQHGRFLGRVTGEVSGNVLLRRKQYRWADDEHETARLAARFVIAKVANSRTVLQRALRDHQGKMQADVVRKAVDYLSKTPGKIGETNDLEQIRGFEGEAAQVYFNSFDQLIVDQKEDFVFQGRVRRPPTDNTNALLSFVYTLLSHEVQAALETVGLDPQVGFLHRDRPGRSGLALDLMEEFRPYLADRLVLNLINRRQVDPKGFYQKESDAVYMDDETRKGIITAWQSRKQETITHPFLEEKIPIGLLPYTQAMLLARHIRGDLEDYPPFFWR